MFKPSKTAGIIILALGISIMVLEHQHILGFWQIDLIGPVLIGVGGAFLTSTGKQAGKTNKPTG